MERRQREEGWRISRRRYEGGLKPNSDRKDKEKAERCSTAALRCSQQLLPGWQEPPPCRRDLAETGWGRAARRAERGGEETQRKMRSNVEGERGERSTQRKKNPQQQQQKVTGREEEEKKAKRSAQERVGGEREEQRPLTNR